MFRISAKTIRQHGTALALIMMVSAGWGVSAKANDHVYDFKIPAEDTAKALNDFARQADIQIMFPYAIAAKHQAPAITGQYTRAEVLNRLLDGTGLEVANVTETTISLRAVTVGAKAPTSSLGNDTTEVVVTGTHIRGGNPTSPIHKVTRKDIDASGYSQIGDLVRSLPENFSGGQNPGVIAASATNIANHNDSNASSMNLRGLGSDATLVLLNGHRLSSDSSSQGVDVSGVPLGAIDHIDVVTDGASAIYGSDAVAGVVNLSLRRNYNGAEVSARVGGATRGGGDEQTVSVLTGRAGEKGYLLMDLERSVQHGITAEDRKLSGAASALTLLRPQTRNSFLVSGGWNFSDNTRLSVDGLVSDRTVDGVVQTSPTGYKYLYATYVPAYSLVGTLDSGLEGSWRNSLTVGSSGSRDSQSIKVPSISYAGSTYYKNSLSFAEDTVTGRLLTLPAGDLKIAAGVGFRREDFQSQRPGSSSYVRAHRSVAYGFAEAQVPILSPSSAVGALDASLSARTESYSDFGSATTPKFGLRYLPFAGLTIRASVGKSFKAPSFLQTYQATQLYLYKATTLGGTGTGTALMTYGGNPDLKAEKSDSWTFGADFTPKQIKSLTISATIYGVHYRDRVVIPVPTYTQALSNSLYAPFVELAPSTSRVGDVVSGISNFYNYTGSAYTASSVVAIVDNQYSNATEQRVQGADLSYRQSFDLSTSQITTFANATWTSLKQRTISTSPLVTLSGTIFNVPKFKTRAGVSWDIGRFSTSGIVNYIDSEKDTGVAPNQKVSSWTTVDATLRYAPNWSGLGRTVSVTLAVSNLLDQRPPYAKSPSLSYAGVSFDSTNSSIIGRFVSLTLKKGW
jgi:outer membrane receptor protein involved in Fe transport